MNFFKMFLLDIITATILFSFAAFLNASMDITAYNFDSSIYSKIAEPGTSTYKYFQSDWKNKWETDENGNLIYDENGKTIPRYFLGVKLPLFNHPLFFDSWHLFKSIMIAILILGMLVIYFKRSRIVFHLGNKKSILIGLALFVWFSIVWNAIFVLFYHQILRI